MGKIYKMVIIFILIFCMAQLQHEFHLEKGNQNGGWDTVPKLSFAVNSSLIYINGNTELESFSSLGNGTIENPFLITDEILDSVNTTSGIYIENTDKHLLIFNCSVTVIDYGIVLNNVSHITIENNELIGHKGYGVVISGSNNVTIIKNDISSNNHAVKVQGSTHITLEKNYILMNYLYGFLLSNSFYCSIIENYLFTNQDGIRLNYSNYNNIFDNNFEYHENAIYLHHSNFNIMVNNYGSDNLYEITENNCENNYFENNFPQQANFTLIVDATVIIVISISFFSIIYIIINVYRYKHLSKSSYL